MLRSGRKEGFRLGNDPLLGTEFSVERNCWVDGAGPGVDAAGERLGMVEALGAEPHGDGEGALAVVAEDDDVAIGVEFGVGSGGDVSHGHQDGSRETGGLGFPRLAHV